MNLDTDKVIIPNWYEKEVLEMVVDTSITRKKFNEFKEWVDGTSLPDEITNMVTDLWYEFERRKK